ncbi:MAG TPA: hypothetical protein VN670_09965 [Acidobacteriaceae bacterium]|nr:hypothetical protein [Acidobacteriaceae bacterium]
MRNSPEQILSEKDPTLGQVIAARACKWPMHPSEDPLWGLIRMVVAQQIATRTACQIAERLKSIHPQITYPSASQNIQVSTLQSFGLPQRRAECCVEIVRRSEEIRRRVRQNHSWEEALAGIKGIGPWTLSVFRIMVLREPDELPAGDVGLLRAFTNVYGPGADLAKVSEKWRPFRSVACWYLWRTLGNEQLG